MTQDRKFAELRAKTDVELGRYVTGELAKGIRFASESNRQSYIWAEEIYAESARLLPLIEGLSAAQRGRLEAQLKRLEKLLEPLPALTQTAG